MARLISILFLGIIGVFYPFHATCYMIIWDTSSIQTVFTPGTADWESHSVLSPCVIYEGGEYKMWYHGKGVRDIHVHRKDGIGYVTSTDGINWTNRQLVHGPYTGYYDTGSPYVIKEGSTYRMWHQHFYEWVAHEWSTYISHMTSSDGVNWSNHRKVLSAQGQGNPQGDGYCVSSPSILKEGSQYIMWYAVKDLPGIGGRRKIWRATSSDGITWGNRQLALPYISGTWESYIAYPHVVKEPWGDYVMYYYANGNIGRAKSSDGINWTKREMILPSASTPFYFQDPNTGTPYLYFTQGGNIVRMSGNIIPEPGTFLLLGTGVIGLAAGLRRKYH